MAYTIDISSSNITFEALNPNPQTVTVTTNGFTDSECYDIVTDINWLSIDRNLGEVKLVPLSDNTKNFGKEGYITFYNRSNSNIFKVLEVKQEYNEYKVEVDKNTLTCNSDEEQTQTIKVTVYGGRKLFYVNTINEYKDGNRIIYDKALKVKIEAIEQEDTENRESLSYNLNITSYGTIEPDATYEIKLTHSDARDIETVINITFEQLDDSPIRIKNQDYLYCEDTSRMVDANKRTKLAPVMKKSMIKAMSNVVEEMNIECNGVLNPEVLDISNKEVRIKIYTVIDNDGVAETDSDIFVRLSTRWAGIRYAREEYTNEYKVIYVAPLQENKYIDRYCTMNIINMERRNQNRKVLLFQKKG